MKSEFKKLPRSFYEQNTESVAKNLLGKLFVHRVNGIEKIGKIVEVEAYLGEHDLACHSSKGITKRTQIMFGPAGFAYVYMIYGMYYCLNVVTQSPKVGSAVLIRALEPVKNINERTQGPGLLCRAMQIDKTLNGHDLLSDDFFITSAEVNNPEFEIITKPRIGVAYAKEWANKPLRFYIKNNLFVSKK